MERQLAEEQCPLFKARHAHHSAVWTVPGFSVPQLCVACATERLESKGELAVHMTYPDEAVKALHTCTAMQQDPTEIPPISYSAEHV